MGSELLAKEFAELLDGDVHEEADVAGAEASDVCDLLVRAVVLEFEADNFPLIVAETIQ